MLIFLIATSFCQKTENQQQKRAFLVETGMTREELESLITQGEAAKFEEGKLASSESKIEKDDDDENDDKKQKQEHAQQETATTTTLIKRNAEQKNSFSNYIFAFLVVVVLLNLYFYGSQKKRLMKSSNLYKNNLNEYILLDSHSC